MGAPDFQDINTKAAKVSNKKTIKPKKVVVAQNRKTCNIKANIIFITKVKCAADCSYIEGIIFLFEC